MREKLKVHDGDTPGKVIEVKLEYPKPKVATMSDMKCPFCGEKIEHIEDGWCNCKNRCTGSGSIELWLQFLRTRKQLEMANAELEYIKEQIEKNGAFDNTRKALDVAVDALKSAHDYYLNCVIREKQPQEINWYCTAMNMDNDIFKALEQITELEQKD